MAGTAVGKDLGSIGWKGWAFIGGILGVVLIPSISITYSATRVFTQHDVTEAFRAEQYKILKHDFNEGMQNLRAAIKAESQEMEQRIIQKFHTKEGRMDEIRKVVESNTQHIRDLERECSKNAGKYESILGSMTNMESSMRDIRAMINAAHNNPFLLPGASQ